MTLALGKFKADGSFVRLPDDFVTQSAAILARRGAGKTYTASVLIEELVGAHLPVVALDPLGVMWGLRASADGKRVGLPVTILGGDHGDLPLEPTAGRIVAQFVAEHPAAYVLDLSGFASLAEQDRFAADFAAALYQAQGRVRTPLHLVVDEADSFAPQRPQRGQERMLGAYENIVRRGRSRGLGVTLISQRPAVLNKNVLSQIEVLIAMQVTAPQDRAALDEWAKGYSTDAERQAFLRSLATLAVGEAWLWSPTWLDVFAPMKVRARRTFDSSATPKPGEKRAVPTRLADVDIDALKDAMADTVAKAEAEDPKTLKARIRDLEREVASLRAETSEPEQVVVEVPFVPEAVVEHLRRTPPLIEAAQEAVAGLLGAIADAAREIESVSGDTRAVREVQPATVARRPSPSAPGATAARGAAQPAPTRPSTGEAPHLRAGARRMLDALAAWPGGLTKAQVATIAGVQKGGTFSTYLRDLVNAGLVVEHPTTKALVATEAGLAAADVTAVPTDPESVRAWWEPRFRAGARRMLASIWEHGPIDRHMLSHYAEIEKGGTFSTYLRDLIRAGLVVERDGLIDRAEWLR